MSNRLFHKSRYAYILLRQCELFDPVILSSKAGFPNNPITHRGSTNLSPPLAYQTRWQFPLGGSQVNKRENISGTGR